MTGMITSLQRHCFSVTLPSSLHTIARTHKLSARSYMQQNRFATVTTTPPLAQACKTVTTTRSTAVSYATYGAPRATASRIVVYLHGYPGCGAEALLWDRLAIKNNVHIIAVDRYWT